MDLAGNVAEWTTTASADGTRRVARGGGWYGTLAEGFSTARRDSSFVSMPQPAIGLRCVEPGG